MFWCFAEQCNLLSNIFIICAGLFMFKLNKTYLIHCINNIYLIKLNLSQEYSSVYIIGLSWEGWIRICIDVPAYIPKWNTGTKELELAILSHFWYDWVMVMQVKWSCYLFGFCCYDPKLNWGCCSMVKQEISFIMELSNKNAYRKKTHKQLYFKWPALKQLVISSSEWFWLLVCSE